MDGVHRSSLKNIVHGVCWWEDRDVGEVAGSFLLLLAQAAPALASLVLPTGSIPET